MSEAPEDRGQEARHPRRMAVSRAPQPLRIAIVCSRFPLPMTRADQMTVAHLLAFLAARGHRVDLFSLVDRAPGDWLSWAAERCDHVEIFKQPWWRRLVGVANAVRRGQPLQVGWFANRAQRRAVRVAVASRGYDVVYGYTLRSAEAVRGLRRNNAGNKLPATYLAMQVSQTLNTRRIAREASRAGERWLYRIEHRLTARYEAEVWRDFTHTTLIGEADVAAVRATCAARAGQTIDNYLLAPHGVDADRFRPREGVAAEPLRLLFCGVMATNTNVAAVLWFVRYVWPQLRATLPGASFAIVGRLPRPEIRALHGRHGVEVTGEVADPAVEIAAAAVCVDPMQAGAGMQNKLLEYFAAGKAVVATSVANEGIGAVPGQHFLAADSADEFTSAAIRLLQDAGLRQRLGAAARAHVLQEWSWERHFARLEDHFYAAGNRAPTARHAATGGAVPSQRPILPPTATGDAQLR